MDSGPGKQKPGAIKAIESNMKTSALIKPVTLLAVLSGLLTGSLLTFFLMERDIAETQVKDSKKEPLYWVAPMDPNYRRDKPGKSPMGMDLIPFYGNNASSENRDNPGTITIDPSVVNNIGVRTAVVERKVLIEEIQTVGYVKYDENKLIHIHPRVAGWVRTLHIKAAGDPVKQGEPLYSLYSPELVNAQDEMLLALNRNDDGLITAAENRLKALQIPSSFIAKLKRNRITEQTITFYSPQSGVIDNLNIREGFYVQPGTTLFSIGSLDQVWVEAEVFERQASLVRQGATASMTLDYLPGITWQGKVDYIYPTLDRKTRTIRLRIPLKNPEHQLLPNMFAQVAIHTHSGDSTLLIPREALIKTGHQNRVVLALGDGRYKSIEVKTGRENRQYAEILEGLEEGEKVVSSAQFLLDSESSKTSDFKRMHQKAMDHSLHHQTMGHSMDHSMHHHDMDHGDHSMSDQNGE